MKKMLKYGFSILWLIGGITGISENASNYSFADWIIILSVLLVPIFLLFKPAKQKINKNKIISTTKENEENSMSLGDLFKGKQYKQELDELKQENESLKELLTPEMQDVLFVKKQLADLQMVQNDKLNLINKLKDSINEKMTQLSSLEDSISDKRKQLICMDDDILVQEFGLYKPQFDFASALDYKEELAAIRAHQKDLIKNKQAVSGATDWTVNGNAAKGKKMVSDTQKLLLRAFNNECDDLVAKVKYTNFDASLDRIYKSAETISKLGTIMNISINKSYLDAKVKELRLAFEYQTKKQQEKEDQKAARAEQREQAKIQRELDEQRKKIEKEQTHYQTAFEKLQSQLELHPDDPDLIEKKEQLADRLSDINKALTDIDYRQANMKAGYVYIISNIGSFGENIYKIGMTRRLDPQDRVDELGDASVPFNFDVHAMIFSDDAPALEAALHRAFANRKLNMVNQRREFFNVTLDEIKDVIKKNFDKTVEFIDVPDAEQYRVSKKIKEEKLYEKQHRELQECRLITH